MQLEATYVGVATVLLRIGELTLLTDPAFDAPGETVSFAPGVSSTRLLGPALSVDALPPIDAVLISHDQHDDNLDRAGRALLSRAGVVITHRSAAKRLGGGSVGLAEFASYELVKGQTRVRVTATPARHGPPLSLPLVGHVIGFLLTWEGQREGAIYFSGDTVLYDGIRQVAQRGPVGTAFLHMGGAAFAPARKVLLTMNAKDAVTATRTLDAKRVFPIHTDGWSHFLDDSTAVASTFADAGLADRLVPWKRGDKVSWQD